MKSFATNWKTTLGGAAAMVGAAADIVMMFAHDKWDGEQLMADLTILSVGLGLLFAKDGNVTGGSKVQQ